MLHLDTHVLLWISQGRINTLGTRAFGLVVRQPWLISSIVILELEILHEIGRLKATPDTILGAAREQGSLSISQMPLPAVIECARDLSWTRDPIDRLVTANAIADGARLITADQTILAHFKDAVWE